MSSLDYMTAWCTVPCCQKPRSLSRTGCPPKQKANLITQTGLPQHSLHIPKSRRLCLRRQMKAFKKHGPAIRPAGSLPSGPVASTPSTSSCLAHFCSTNTRPLDIQQSAAHAIEVPGWGLLSSSQRGLRRVTCLLSRISSRSRAVSGVSALAKHSGLVSAASAILDKALQLVNEAHGD